MIPVYSEIETKHVDMNMTACEGLKKPFRSSKCKTLPHKKLMKYLNDSHKMNKYLKQLVQCKCKRICCPWEVRYEFEKRRGVLPVGKSYEIFGDATDHSS